MFQKTAPPEDCCLFEGLTVEVNFKNICRGHVLCPYFYGFWGKVNLYKKKFYCRAPMHLVLLREKRLYNCRWWIQANFESPGGAWVLNFRHGPTLKVPGVCVFLILDTGEL